jgi:hypothetical protein
MGSSAIILSVIVFGMAAVFEKEVSLTSAMPILESGLWIDDVYVNQSRFHPGEDVKITAKVTNRVDRDFMGKVIIVISHLGV